MATVVSITNPITGAVEQVDKLDHTAQQIDDAVALAPQLSNPNLLDNWYFGNPVNQRGKTEYTGNSYYIDRWRSWDGDSSSLSVVSGGIKIAGTLYQYLESVVFEELWGKTVAISLLLADGTLYTDSFVLKMADWYSVRINAHGLNSIQLGINNDDFESRSNNFFRVIPATVGTLSDTILAAKLELGSQQTLAHQDADGNWVLNEIPNYGEQLRRCQRYFCRFNFGRNDLFFGSLTSNLDKAWITIPTPVVMRTAPSVSFSGTFNGVIRGNGFQLEFLTGNSTVAADTSTTRCCNILITPNTKPSAWTAQQVVMIYTSTEWYMDCSADL